MLKAKSTVLQRNTMQHIRTRCGQNYHKLCIGDPANTAALVVSRIPPCRSWPPLRMASMMKAATITPIRGQDGHQPPWHSLTHRLNRHPLISPASAVPIPLTRSLRLGIPTGRRQGWLRLAAHDFPRKLRIVVLGPSVASPCKLVAGTGVIWNTLLQSRLLRRIIARKRSNRLRISRSLP
jgi:hypothetical protein